MTEIVSVATVASGGCAVCNTSRVAANISVVGHTCSQQQDSNFRHVREPVLAI